MKLYMMNYKDERWEHIPYGSQNLERGCVGEYGLTHFLQGPDIPIPKGDT
jgi:hypothetical protein